MRELVVDSRISMDIDRVQIGQSAEVRFAVLKMLICKGTLVKLSADRLVDEESGLPYYSAEVKLLEEDLHLLRYDLIPECPQKLIKTALEQCLGISSPMQRIIARPN